MKAPRGGGEVGCGKFFNHLILKWHVVILGILTYLFGSYAQQRKAEYMYIWIQDKGWKATPTVWVKKNPPPLRLSEFFSFFHKRLRIFNRFFRHPLPVLMYARLQIFVQLSPTLTKLCHIKRDNPVHILCAKCPKRAKTRAFNFRRLCKSLIALLIVVCGKSL